LYFLSNKVIVLPKTKKFMPMKKNVCTLLLCSALILSCGKKDTPDPTPTPTPTPDVVDPVITLVGNVNDTVSLNANYADPGATATDNVDGNITASIVITGNLNTNQTGDYLRKYNVSDAAGNAANEITRFVHVKNDAGFLAGTYQAVPNCGSTPSSQYNTNITVSSTVNNEFQFSNLLYNTTGKAAVCTLGSSKTTFTVNTLTGNNGVVFSATGQVNSNKTISLNSAQSSGFANYICNTLMTKQ